MFIRSNRALLLLLYPKKNAEKAEKLLNETTEQGCELKFNFGVMWLLEREKQ